MQFRNCATLGGSVFGRFSFSDVATALLALEAEVELVRGGILPLGTFLETSPGQDILVKVRLPREKTDAAYQSLRNSATDLPAIFITKCVRSQKVGG